MKKQTKKVAKKIAAKPTKKQAKKQAKMPAARKQHTKKKTVQKKISKNKHMGSKFILPKKSISKKIGSKPQSRQLSRSEISRKRLISKNLMDTISKQFQIMLSPNEFIVRLLANDMREIEQHLGVGKSLVYCLLCMLKKWHPDYFDGVELSDASPAPQKDELGEITDGTMFCIAASSPGNWQADEETSTDEHTTKDK